MAHNTLGDIKTILRRAAKRGTALDADLNGAIRRAASWIEKNHTLQYMRRRFVLNVGPGDSEVDVPDDNIKAFLTPIRWDQFGTDGTYAKCYKRDLDDADYPESRHYGNALPSSFELDGMEKLIFNAPYGGTVPLVGVGKLARYSDFPLEDNSHHWLFDHGESIIITQAMLELGVVSTRDERTYQMYLSHRQDQITVMLNADYETVYSGADDSL